MRLKVCLPLLLAVVFVGWLVLRAQLVMIGARSLDLAVGDAPAAADAGADGPGRHLASLRPIVPWPRVIHMTWKTSTLPSWAQSNWDSWEQHNPGWTRRLWDDAGVDAFVAREFPEIMPFWKTALKPVQRADVFRCLREV